MLTPFDVVYQRLAQDLKDSADFKAGNVISFLKDSDPSKPSVQTSDLPEVVLYLANCGGNFTENSSSVKLTPVYKYMISIGSYNSELAHKLLFNALRLNADWPTVLGPLVWKGRKFVQNARIVSVEHGQSNSKLNRNISGWVSIVAIEFEFYINKEDFLQGLT